MAGAMNLGLCGLRCQGNAMRNASAGLPRVVCDCGFAHDNGGPAGYAQRKSSWGTRCYSRKTVLCGGYAATRFSLPHPVAGSAVFSMFFVFSKSRAAA